MAERLRGAGYEPAGLYGNIFVGPLAGLDRGYSFFQKVLEIRPEYVAHLLDRVGSRPFYLYLHSVEPHNPYRTPKRLIERFGDAILAAPRPEGFGLAAYLVPVLVFLAGGVLVGILLRRFTRVQPLPAAGVALHEPLDPELERQVDEELAR